MADPAGNDELDSLIWHFLRDQDGHPTNNNQLIAAARGGPTEPCGLFVAAGSGWRRIDSRIQAMRRAGRIRFYRGPRGANPNRPAHVRSHGWEVLGCPGEGFNEDGQWDWREGCSDCLRRTNPDPDAGTVEPPLIIAFECELRIAP
jgi:hypothetical protein